MTCSRQVFAANYPDVDVGLHGQLPARQERRGGERWRERELERDQANARLRSVELKAVRRDARRRRCGSSRTGSASKRRGSARELAEQRLDAEQRRFEVGMST